MSRRSFLRRLPLLPLLPVLMCGVSSEARAEPPRRMLELQWRVVEAQRQGVQALAAQGGLVVGTAGRVDAHGQVTLRRGQQQARTERVQRLQVLNGGTASVRVAEQLPWQWVTLASTPRGAAAIVHPGWVERGQAVQLRPLWPGGSAPVQVRVQLQVRAPGPDETMHHEAWQTELLLPLAEWVTVARSGQPRREARQGVLGSGDAEHQQERLLQLRVDLP